MSAPETFDFDHIPERRGTSSVKYDKQAAIFGADAIEIGMGIADMDFRVVPIVTEALQARVRHENWGYLDSPTSLVAAVIAWNTRRYGVDLQPSQLVLSEGVHPAIIAAQQAFAPPGSGVLLLTPVYNAFYEDLEFLQLRPEESPLVQAAGRYEIDFDDFERRARGDSKVCIVSNPHNPTGNCWSANDLERLGEICLRQDVVLLVDEIHCDFINSGARHPHTPFATLTNRDIVNNAVVFTAASKSFGLAAHKVAWFYSSNPALLERIKKHHWVDLNTLGVVANEAAYRGGEEWLRQCVRYVDGTHDLVQERLTASLPLIGYRKPDATYLAWLDVSAVAEAIDASGNAARASQDEGRSVSAEEMVQRFFVREAKVQLNPGSWFGRGGEGHMRMNIATSRQLVERALDNMAAALERL